MRFFTTSPRFIAWAAGAAAFACFVAGAPVPARAVPGLFDTIYTAGFFDFSVSTFPNRASISRSITGGVGDVDFWSFAVVGAGRVTLEAPFSSSGNLGFPLLSVFNASNESIAEVAGRNLFSPFLNVGTYFARIASVSPLGGGSYNLTVQGYAPGLLESGAVLARATPLAPPAIPEPGTLALCILGGSGGLALVGARRRLRKAA